MKPSFVLVLFAAGLFFVLVDQAFLAGLCLIAALVVFAYWFFSGSWHAAKATANGLTKGIASEVSKVEATSPASRVFEEGLKNAADLAGQQAFAQDKHQFRFKGFASIGEACQRLIGLFKKVFK